MTGHTPDETGGRVVLCEPRRDCADQNVNRWHCMRGHDGDGHAKAELANVCPLKVCEMRGANS